LLILLRSPRFFYLLFVVVERSTLRCPSAPPWRVYSFPFPSFGLLRTHPSCLRPLAPRGSTEAKSIPAFPFFEFLILRFSAQDPSLSCPKQLSFLLPPPQENFFTPLPWVAPWRGYRTRLVFLFFSRRCISLYCTVLLPLESICARDWLTFFFPPPFNHFLLYPFVQVLGKKERSSMCRRFYYAGDLPVFRYRPTFPPFPCGFSGASFHSSVSSQIFHFILSLWYSLRTAVVCSPPS